MQDRNRLTKIKRIFALALIVAIAAQGILVFADDAGDRTAAPVAENCSVYVYDKDNTENPRDPAMYMWSIPRTSEAMTVRVYSDVDCTNCIGTATSSLSTFTCIVYMDRDAVEAKGYSGYLYVTQQENGKTESAPASVSFVNVGDPKIGFNVHLLSGANVVENPVTAAATYAASPKFMYGTTRPYASAGQYYRVDVFLKGFGPIESVTLPIKYDPEIWQPVSLIGGSYNETPAYYLGDTVYDLYEETRSGCYMDSWDRSVTSDNIQNPGGYPAYGVGIYSETVDWGGYQDTSTKEQTPYINTQTGLIKLELTTTRNHQLKLNVPGRKSGDSKRTPLTYQNGSAAEVSMVRIYFKLLRKPTQEETGDSWDASPMLHFATEADVPEGLTYTQKKAYYAAISPNGAKVGIQTMNVQAEQPTVSAWTSEDKNALLLSADQIRNLPQSISLLSSSTDGGEDTDGAEVEDSEFINKVKVYNYSNSTENTLDGDIEDVLILTPSDGSVGSVKYQDVITVYQDDMVTPAARSVKANEEGGATVFLGNDVLSPEGGFLYVSVKRDGIERKRVKVPYPAEVSRDVYFKVHITPSGLSEDTPYYGTEGIDFKNLKEHDIRVGYMDKVRLDLCFNNFDDLLSYTFALHFNSGVLHPTDIQYRYVDTGYITEKAFEEQTSCLVKGKDLSELTVNEQLAYEYWARWDQATGDKKTELEASIVDVLPALGYKSFDDFVAAAQELKKRKQLSGWNGGLLFTGGTREAGTYGEDDPGREESTLYPYVDVDTGLIKIAAASIERPAETLSAPEGYHFLSIYFLGVGSPNEAELAELRLATFRQDNTGAYDEANPSGGEIVLSGPGKLSHSYTKEPLRVNYVSAMNYNAHWLAYTDLEEDIEAPQIELEVGNGYEGRYSYYIYENEPYVEPGVAVFVDGLRLAQLLEPYYLVDGDDTRHYVHEGETTFSLDPGERYRVYTLIYAYEYKSGGETKTVEARRLMRVVHHRGDVNCDGAVDVFDEQMLANILNDFQYDIEDGDLYWDLYPDVDLDGAVTEDDRALLRDYNLGFDVEIEQDFAAEADEP